MQLPAIAVYTGNDQIHRVTDLAGRTVGIGGDKGLLHVLMLALLRKHGVDAASVKFVNVGSNAEVLEAVLAGKVDAGPSGTAGLSGARPVRVLDDGRLWLELPEYTYQPAYASVRALHDNPQGLARCMAAYTRLYRFLSGPRSEAAYLAARRRATGEASDSRVAWLQQLNVALGLQARVLPYEQVADPGPARAARRLLG
jgi:ABC-type nitrate/sulfonate/bicarbonate transport system substrate-binding protein